MLVSWFHSLILNLSSLMEKSFDYQKYFGKSQNIGFDIKGIFGAGYLHMLRKNNTNIIYPADVVAKGDDKIALITDYIPLTFELETNFLFDIFEKDKHAFGLNLGCGYSFVYESTLLQESPVWKSMH